MLPNKLPRVSRTATRKPFSVSWTLHSSSIVFIDSLSFPLVDPPLRLELHRKRDNVAIIFAMIIRSHDLFPAHWAFGDAFAGLGALIFARY